MNDMNDLKSISDLIFLFSMYEIIVHGTLVLVMQYWLSKHKQRVINKFTRFNFGRFRANLVTIKSNHENNKVKGLAVTCGFGRGRREFYKLEKKLSIPLKKVFTFF